MKENIPSGLKSKEEILDKSHWNYVCEKGISSIHTETFPSAYKEQAMIAMEEYAKQFQLSSSTSVQVEDTNNDDIYEIEDIDKLREMLVTKRADSRAWCKRAMQEVDSRRELQKEIKHLKAGFLAASPKGKEEDELKELRAWKESAMRVMPDFQAIGKELGLKLGDTVHDKILPAIIDYKKQLGITG